MLSSSLSCSCRIIIRIIYRLALLLCLFVGEIVRILLPLYPALGIIIRFGCRFARLLCLFVFVPVFV
eukprot:m.55194 g.55194  ORF g.55194 m.55194 type:complete len:67 (-) comp48847_c0_seq2:145-345(-)